MRGVGKRATVCEEALRPSVPLLLVCALCMWAASATSYSLGRDWGRVACSGVALAAGLAVFTFALLLWRRGASYLWASLVGLALGACCGCAGASSLLATMEALADSPSATWRFELAEDASAGAYGKTCFARAVSPDGDSLLVRLSLDESVEAHRYGDTFTARAKLATPEGTTAQRCWQKGAAATARITDASHASPVERKDALAPVLALRRDALSALGQAGGDASAVLQALVCGEREKLAQSTLYGDFKAAGLAHMVAVSGAHLVIVSGFVALALRALRAPCALAVVLQTAFVLAYLAFAGMPVSALRAAIMSVAGMASYASRRRPAPLNALGLCIMALIAVFPSTAVSVSFALSAGSTLGIVLLAGLFSSWMDGLPVRFPRAVCDALALTFAASVVTMPASAALFAQVSLVAPLANVVCSPLFAVVCAGGLVSALIALAFPPAATLAAGVAGAGASFLNGLVGALARLPLACVPVSAPVLPMIALSVAATGLLWWFWPQVRARYLALSCGGGALAFVLWAAASPFLAGTEIAMLDVGQGDAFLVRSGGCAMLIDTGNRDQALREALARHGVTRLDAVVVTHADDDHCASLASLRGVVDVRSVLVARDALECGCASCAGLRKSAEDVAGAEGCAGLSVGDVLHCGSVDLRVVWPFAYQDEGGNADSLCLLASYDPENDGTANWTALFCGDAEAKQINELGRKGLAGTVDIYKVGHHGSRAALDDEAAHLLSPRIALVSVGAENRYGHPAAETLERLASVGAKVFRTDEQGDVSCKLEPDEIRVTTLR